MQMGTPTKGELAYTLRRDTGKTWEDVAAEVGSASPEAAIAGAKKYAIGHDLPWPIHTILHRAQERVVLDEQRAQARRDARVYEAVTSGTPVSEIAGLSVTNVYRALDRHVAETGDPRVPRNAERAYMLRQQGESTWAEIASRLGYVRETAAIEAARVHAQTHGLPWPLGVEPSKKSPEQYVGKLFYDAVREGQSWKRVASETGKPPSYAKARAKVYAKAHNLPWPI